MITSRPDLSEMAEKILKCICPVWSQPFDLLLFLLNAMSWIFMISRFLKITEEFLSYLRHLNRWTLMLPSEFILVAGPRWCASNQKCCCLGHRLMKQAMKSIRAKSWWSTCSNTKSISRSWRVHEHGGLELSKEKGQHCKKNCVRWPESSERWIRTGMFNFCSNS